MSYHAGALFSGIGGFCEGFRESGIETTWATDIDDRVANSYTNYYGKDRFIHADIKSVKDGVVGNRMLEPVDVLHAGFPCQSFSMAGDRRGFDDPRGQLFFELMRVITEFGVNKPSILVFENSPYLQIGERGDWFRQVKNEIQKAGYWFKDSNAVVLDPQKHLGLPQYRPRLYMFAFNRARFRTGRFELKIDPPKENIRLSDVIDFDGEVDDYYYLDIENRYHAMISSNRKNQEHTLYQLRKFQVRTKDHCPTLTANMGLGGHNVPFLFDKRGLRKLTEKECLRLQGFDEFYFPDDIPLAAKYQQIGNAVHVKIASEIGKMVVEKLGEAK